MSAKHKEIYEKFSATFPPETVGRWVWMVEHWKSNPKAPNLYNESEHGKYLSIFFQTITDIASATTLSV